MVHLARDYSPGHRQFRRLGAPKIEEISPRRRALARAACAPAARSSR
jgi:hypothetical protein